MKNHTTLIFIYCLFGAYFLSVAQQPPVENCYGADATLYNGALYSFYVYPSTEGTPFYQSPAYQTGSCTIRGITYNDVDLNYDVYNQQVIYRYKSTTGGINRIVLSDAWLQSFQFMNQSFVLLSNNDSNTTVYRVIGDEFYHENRYRILYHYYKDLTISSGISSQNMRFTPLAREAYLQKDNDIYRFKNNHSFIGLFNRDDQPVIRKYLRQNNINMRKEDDAKVASLLEFIRKAAL
jgi:hypothetical protein